MPASSRFKLSISDPTQSTPSAGSVAVRVPLAKRLGLLEAHRRIARTDGPLLRAAADDAAHARDDSNDAE